eukprot:gene18684-biopygen5438
MARAWRGLQAIFALRGAGVARACPVTPQGNGRRRL